MVFDLKRTITGLFILLTVFLSYIFKLDLVFTLLIISLIIYDLFYSKILILNNYLIIFSTLFLIILLFYLSSFIFSVISLLTFIILTIFNIRYLKIFFVFFLFSNVYLMIYLNSIDRNIFYLIFFLSFINDSSAFIFGKFIKGPKIVPRISPNKTWSGTIFSFIITFSILIFLGYNFIYCIVLSLCYFLGDLHFSFIKRKLKIKDFSNIFQSHGGALDRLDSIFLPIFIYLILDKLI